MNNFIPVNEPLLNGNEKKYLEECIDTGWISSEGPFVKEFEEEHEELNELHRMRYLFLPEITTLFELNGLRMVQAGEWLTGKQPGCDTWGLCCVGIDS